MSLTDTTGVLKSTPSASAVNAGVTTLPDSFLVRRSGDLWAVVGPTGLFLVAQSDQSPGQVAERTAIAAHHLRNRLAEVLDTVPFIDAVVVSSRIEQSAACTLIGAPHLESFLTHGPAVIPEGELQLLRHHLPAVLSNIELDGGLG